MRTTLVSILLCSAAVCLSPAPVESQEPAPAGRIFDAFEKRSSTVARAACYVHESYIVVERGVMEVGSDLFIRSRETGRCDADSIPGDFVLRNESAEYFLGLRGHLLFIDSGTGPDLRGLILVDLRTRRRLLDVAYLDVAPGPDSMSISFWSGYFVDEPPAGCEIPEGLYPGVDSLFVIDLATAKLRFGDRTRCASRQ